VVDATFFILNPAVVIVIHGGSIVGYQCFRGTCYIYSQDRQEVGHNIFLQNW